METVAVISKVQKGFIAAIGLSIVIVIVSLIGINSQTRESSSPEANEQKPFEPVTEVTENFYLRISGDLFKTETGYRLDEGFIPSLAQTLPKDQAQTPYSIVATDIDGSQKTYYSLAKYCAPTGSDYCIGKDALLMPIGERSFWEPTTILITNVTQSIEIRVQNKTIKTFQKVGRGPSILSFSKKEAKQKLYGEERSGIDVTWEIEDGNNGRSWPLLEYMTNEESWQPLYAFLDPKKYRSYFIDPKSNIHTTLDVITLRLLVTDGFFLAQQNLEPIPLTIEDKKITLSLSGVTHGGIRTVGQNTNIDVRFMDPETGIGCNGQGCAFEGSEPRYKVTWFSSKQNICEGDVYNGVLMYTYKKVGEHKIGVRVEHAKKPEINAEISATVTVEPSLFPLTDNSPNCSY